MLALANRTIGKIAEWRTMSNAPLKAIAELDAILRRLAIDRADKARIIVAGIGGHPIFPVEDVGAVEGQVERKAAHITPIDAEVEETIAGDGVERLRLRRDTLAGLVRPVAAQLQRSLTLRDRQIDARRQIIFVLRYEGEWRAGQIAARLRGGQRLRNRQDRDRVKIGRAHV